MKNTRLFGRAVSYLSIVAAICIFVFTGVYAGTGTKTKNSFDRILQYTLMNETLPDGKHPVWIYYEIKGKTIMRVTMPSLDLCGVMQNSKSDIDILNNNMADSIKKGSDDWNMALDIWKIAFDKYMLTGTPTHCK